MSSRFQQMAAVSAVWVGVVSLLRVWQSLSGKKTTKPTFECTEAPHLASVDPDLHALLNQHEQIVCEFDKVGFIQLLEHLDKLLFLRGLLESKKIEPTIEDRISAFQTHQTVRSSVARLRTHNAQAPIHPKQKVGVETFLATVEQSAESHLGAVMLFTLESRMS